MPDKICSDLAKYRIEKAKACLQTADVVYSTEDYLAVLNGSYYAN